VALPPAMHSETRANPHETPTNIRDTA
jgi:hypothetical protein